MDGSHSLLFRSDSSLALRCRKGAIHPIIQSSHHQRRAAALLGRVATVVTKTTARADNVALGALHNGKQFLVLRLRYIEFRHRVIEVLAESDPLALGDLEVLMRFAHGTASVVLGATCGPTTHPGHVAFEARRADAVMRLFNCSVRVQDWIVHTRSMKSSTTAAIE